MTKVILHLGSNIGFRDINLELARIMISNHIGDILESSSIYETAAWGHEDQSAFYNQALSCHTALSPQETLKTIHLIERKMGRIKTAHWGPRIIDVDIIFFGDKIVEEVDLKIPHPQLTNRNFVLVPLLDICPLKIHPILQQSVAELAARCEDQGQVEIV